MNVPENSEIFITHLAIRMSACSVLTPRRLENWTSYELHWSPRAATKIFLFIVNIWWPSYSPPEPRFYDSLNVVARFRFPLSMIQDIITRNQRYASSFLTRFLAVKYGWTSPLINLRKRKIRK
jgi:hypothetical protein